MLFSDRTEAGRRLAAALEHMRGESVVVLGLPRGGVPVAFEVANALGAPLDVIVVRKVGAPSQPELAMGAIGEDGVRIVNERVVNLAGITEADFTAVERREREELERRVRRFRNDHPRVPLEGRTAVVVDDGIATGSTARTACQVARAHGAVRTVLAIPVAPPETVEQMRLEPDIDEVVCLETPRFLRSIGEWYADFSQTSEERVLELLRQSPARVPAPRAAEQARSGAMPGPRADEEIEIEADGRRLSGHLNVPVRAAGVVVFAHGSGSGRRSPRNRSVAEFLNAAGLGTLLFDLLTPLEAEDRANTFDIPLLAGRLAAATRWLRERPEAINTPIGYFGASTGAAAALWAAAESGSDIAAVVSRGGRPDLAESRLELVRAATLLIVGGNDPTVLDLNHRAQTRLRCENQLTVVRGATHLFEEPGALETVADMARDWFLTHLTRHDVYQTGTGG